MRIPKVCSDFGLLALIAVALFAAPVSGQADSPSVTWDEKIEVAAGGGHRGPWRMNESEYDYVDDPTVAIDDQGFVGVAWADQPRHDIFFQLYGPDGKERLDEPVNVSRSSRTFSWLPRMVIAPDDASRIAVLWQEIVFSGGSHGGEIFFARSIDGGKTFSDPINLSNSLAGDGKGRLTARRWDNGSLDLALGSEGDLYAAWTEYDGNLWFSRSTDGGNGFSEPLRVAGSGNRNPARGPSLTVGADGTVYLAWTVGEDAAADIRFAKSADSGRSFGETLIVIKSDGHADAPTIAVDSKGILHLAYAESPRRSVRAFSYTLHPPKRWRTRVRETESNLKPANRAIRERGFPVAKSRWRGQCIRHLGSLPGSEKLSAGPRVDHVE